MAEQWERRPANQVVVGDRVRARGAEITVARIETSFLGREGTIAFVEDLPARWLKVPTPRDADVEVLREA
jgi:hypothetical protein